jgi:mRNA-degrading endonuclease RelE of RelBE toxin-antitoxin system
LIASAAAPLYHPALPGQGRGRGVAGEESGGRSPNVNEGIDGCSPMHYLCRMTLPPITVVETTTFKNEIDKLLDDEAQRELIGFIASNPMAGDIMAGTGGVRKLRWARKNEGQSSGYRIIYFYLNDNFPVFVFKIYPQNIKDNLTKGERNKLKILIPELIKSYRER